MARRRWFCVYTVQDREKDILLPEGASQAGDQSGHRPLSDG